MGAVYPLWESNHSTGQPRRGKDHLCAAPCRCLYHWRDASVHEAHTAVSSDLSDRRGRFGRYRQTPLIEAAADLDRVLVIDEAKRELTLSDERIEKAIVQNGARLIILDPETGFEWIGEYDITADELLSGAGGNNANKTEQAEKLILDLLADGKELASEDIEKAAADAEISARTVRAAKKNLDGRITSKRIGAAWYHALKK